jgi:hypothetical protein
MLKVRFTESPRKLTTRVASRIRSEVKILANDLYTEVRAKTPVDTGTAKAGWTKNVRADGFTISNNVSYIGVLDKGRHMTNRGMRGSKQAPRGIVGPSLESIKRKN